ncbi:MAG TPA: hypothetical protein VH561_18100 [Micromonosporaceae bacterium]
MQLELVRATGAVALMPVLTLPTNDRTIAISDTADVRFTRRLVAVTLETPPTPALTALVAAVEARNRRSDDLHDQ